jgi:hypothetical protein
MRGIDMREREIATAVVPEGKEDFFLWDDRIKGLALRVRARSKTFVFKTRIDGRARWLKIGRWGPITLTEARKIAPGFVVEIASGKDPAESRRRKTSLQDIFELWLVKSAVPGRG